MKFIERLFHADHKETRFRRSLEIRQSKYNKPQSDIDLTPVLNLEDLDAETVVLKFELVPTTSGHPKRNFSVTFKNNGNLQLLKIQGNDATTRHIYTIPLMTESNGHILQDLSAYEVWKLSESPEVQRLMTLTDLKQISQPVNLTELSVIHIGTMSSIGYPSLDLNLYRSDNQVFAHCPNKT